MRLRHYFDKKIGISNHPFLLQMMTMLLFGLLVLILAGGLLPEAQAADFTASNETQLNSAIAGANLAGAGSHTITLLSDITLNSPTTAIDNSEAAQIRIEGNGFTIDGNGHGPLLTINAATVVTVNDTAITGGRVALDGAGIYNQGTLVLQNSVVSDNLATEYGGGIFNSGALTLVNTILAGNTADLYDGGGLYNDGGQVELFNSTVSDNQSANSNGGGIYNKGGELMLVNSSLRDNSALRGGGIDNVNGTLTITSSTISANRADEGGGGLINDTGGEMTITNSTISGNMADEGGGIFNVGVLGMTAAITLTHTTLTENAATNIGGGVFNFALGATTAINLANTVIANSPDGGDCVSDNGAMVIDSGFNLVEDNSCGFSGGVDPQLSPLQDNGGPTETHQPSADSPLVNVIPDGESSCGTTVTNDQRGISRPQPNGGACDIGAIERDQGDPAPTQTYTPTATSSQHATPTMTTTPTPELSPAPSMTATPGPSPTITPTTSPTASPPPSTFNYLPAVLRNER